MLDDSTMHVQIGPQQGSYPSAPTHRWVSIAIHNVLMPNTVRTPTGEDLIQLVSWDSNTLTASIDLGAVDVGLGGSVQIGWNGSPRSQLLCRSGHIGWQRLSCFVYTGVGKSHTLRCIVAQQLDALKESSALLLKSKTNIFSRSSSARASLMLL